MASSVPETVAREFDSSRPDAKRHVVTYQVLGADEGLVPQNSWNRVERFQPSLSAFFRCVDSYKNVVRRLYSEKGHWAVRYPALCGVISTCSLLNDLWSGVSVVRYILRIYFFFHTR